MAIISCPECQGKISDTVNQCVHCGAKITVCKECGKAYAEKINVCSECGYSFVSSNEAVQEEKISLEITSACRLTENWEGGNPFFKHIFKKKLVTRVFSVIIDILVISAIFKIIGWNSLEETKTVFDGAKNLVVLAIVVWLVSEAYKTFADFGKDIFIFNWCKAQGINLNYTIASSINTNFNSMPLDEAKKELDALKCCADASFNANDYLTRSKLNIMRAVRIGCMIVCGLLIFYFFSTNLEIYMSAELWESEELGISGFEFSMIKDWWCAILAAVLYIGLDTLLEISMENVEEKALETWFVKSFPDSTELYQKYLKPSGVREYIASRSETTVM